MAFAVSQLSLPIRLTVVLHCMADVSGLQFARELSAPEGMAKARLARARAQMGGHVSEHEEADRV